jgi:hypothetical protein
MRVVGSRHHRREVDALSLDSDRWECFFDLQNGESMFTRMPDGTSSAARFTASAACRRSASILLVLSLHKLSPQLTQPSLKWGEQKDAVKA